MSITLNEIAIQRLLESPEGPVGRDLRRRAEVVASAASRNAARIVPQAGAYVGYDIRSDSQGLVATVGTDGSGRIALYLESKAIREREGGWLTSALEFVDL